MCGCGKAPRLDCHVYSLIKQGIEDHGNCLGFDTHRRQRSGNWWLEGSPQPGAVLKGARDQGQRVGSRPRRPMRLSRSGGKMQSFDSLVSEQEGGRT